VALVGGLIWLGSTNTGTSTTKSTPAPAREPQKAAKYVPPYPTQPLLPNGTFQTFTDRRHVAPLEINASSDANFLVKLVDISTNTPVMTIFVRKGMAASVDVPLGQYEFRYASGEEWYGYEHLFGPDTGYSKADKIFHFRDTGFEMAGYSVTLYRVPHGNLQTVRIPASRF
jgi:hypothetical protein